MVQWLAQGTGDVGAQRESLLVCCPDLSQTVLCVLGRSRKLSLPSGAGALPTAHRPARVRPE